MPDAEEQFAKRVVGPLKLSIPDRLGFGVISAFFGLLIGGLITLIVIVVFSYVGFGHGLRCNTWLVWFSMGYFFVVGLFRGAKAAEVIVIGLAASAAAVIGGIGVAGGGATLDGNPTWKRSMWWSVAYFVGVGLIAWLA